LSDSSEHIELTFDLNQARSTLKV